MKVYNRNCVMKICRRLAMCQKSSQIWGTESRDWLAFTFDPVL